MFYSKWFRPNAVYSDEGFQVDLPGIYRLEYKDQTGLTVYFTNEIAYPDFTLLTLSISSYVGSTFTELSDVQRAQVIANIKAALEWKGFKVHLVEGA